MLVFEDRAHGRDEGGSALVRETPGTSLAPSTCEDTASLNQMGSLLELCSWPPQPPHHEK